MKFKRLATVNSVEQLFIKFNVYLFNFRILHWKVKDYNFDILHELMETYYNRIFEDIDTVAEFMVSQGMILPDLKTIINSDYVLLDTNIDYDETEIMNNIDNLFNSILDTITNVYNQEEVIKNPGFSSCLDEMFAFYDKELNYKNRNRRG